MPLPPPLRWLLSLAPGRTRQLYTLDAPSTSASAAIVASGSAAMEEAEASSLSSQQVIISSLSGEGTEGRGRRQD